MCRLFAYVSRQKLHHGTRGSALPQGSNDKLDAYLAAYLGLANTGNVMPDRDSGHQDGWGIASLEEDKWRLVKESTGATLPGSTCAEMFQETARHGPDVVIAHLRKSTQGAHVPENSHPFYFGGYVFCHNGDVSTPEKLGEFIGIDGTTDSERYFRALVEGINGGREQIGDAAEQDRRATMSSIEPSTGPDTSTGEHLQAGPAPLPPKTGSRISTTGESVVLGEAGLQAFKNRLQDIRENFGHTSLTMLFGSNDMLVAYREYNHKHSKYRAAVLGAYYTLYVHEGEDSTVICSEPVGGKVWQKIGDRELIIADRASASVRRERL